MGIPVVPIGPHLRPTAAPGSSVTRALSSPEQRRLLVEGTVAAQFATISQAAEGCDAIIGRLDGARATLHVLDIARASSGRPGPGPAGRTRGPGAVFGAALAGTGTLTRRRASDPHDPQARDPLDGGEVVILRDDR
jgi:hypothetical protein